MSLTQFQMAPTVRASSHPALSKTLFAWILLVGSVFLAAFLGFQIQPLVGKIVTPKFGGGVNVWSICVLFFQTAVLGGYLLTFLLSRCSPKAQCIIYPALFVASVLAGGIAAPAAWTPTNWDNPGLTLMIMLMQHLAAPTILLFSVSGMIQVWFSQLKLGNPYPLYSLSNIGSLSALLSYPIFIEPTFSLSSTLQMWHVGYILLVGFLVGSAFVRSTATTSSDVAQVSQAAAGEPAASTEAPSLRRYAWWVLLSALSSVSLVSYTALLTQDIAPIPMLFVLPLALFLLSFVFCFSEKSPYNRKLFAYLTPFLWLLQSPMHFRHFLPDTYGGTFIAYNVCIILLFVFCFSMLCQGEIASSKPDPKHLPAFYLATAIGGCLGSGFVDFVAPLVFSVYAEPFLIGIFLLLYFRNFALSAKEERRSIRRLNLGFLGLLYVLVLSVTFFGFRQPPNVLAQARNFYGCYRIVGYEDAKALFDGDTLHGLQWLSPEKRSEPTKYYGRESGLASAERLLRQRLHRPINVAVIGLGAGTIACYGQQNDEIAFYEIDPKVVYAANEYFSFIKDSKAKVEVEIGDGRAKLERGADKKFDMIVVDAFSGDTIPVHVLTCEAVKVYLSRLDTHGLLAFNISNRYLDLEPIVGNIAHALGLNAWTIDAGESTWIVASRDSLPELKAPRAAVNQKARVWSDDYSNVLSAFQLNGLKSNR